MCAFGSLECRTVLPLLFPQILFPVLSKEEGISVRFNQSHHQFAHPYLYIQSFFRSIFYRNSIAIIIKNETIPSVFLMAVEIAFPFLVFEVGSKSQVSVKVKARRSFKPPPPPPPPPPTFVSFPPSSSLIALQKTIVRTVSSFLLRNFAGLKRWRDFRCLARESSRTIPSFPPSLSRELGNPSWNNAIPTSASFRSGDNLRKFHGCKRCFFLASFPFRSSSVFCFASHGMAEELFAKDKLASTVVKVRSSAF